MLNQIKDLVYELLNSDNSGHGIDHIIRVYDLALKFADTEQANKEIVAIASLLHDVDDYKIVGIENSGNLTNAKNIMNKVDISTEIQTAVLDIIQNMGYSKFLGGIRPKSLEGKIVSDADMCDAMGSSGIIRSVIYTVSDKGSGVIFDKNVYPNVNITAKEYNSQGTTHDTDSAINHFFEKLLKLPNLMMSNAGKQEALKRSKIMIDFLENLFYEENALEWTQYLDNYIKKLQLK